MTTYSIGLSEICTGCGFIITKGPRKGLPCLANTINQLYCKKHIKTAISIDNDMLADIADYNYVQSLREERDKKDPSIRQAYEAKINALIHEDPNYQFNEMINKLSKLNLIKLADMLCVDIIDDGNLCAFPNDRYYVPSLYPCCTYNCDFTVRAFISAMTGMPIIREFARDLCIKYDNGLLTLADGSCYKPSLFDMTDIMNGYEEITDIANEDPSNEDINDEDDEDDTIEYTPA